MHCRCLNLSDGFHSGFSCSDLEECMGIQVRWLVICLYHRCAASRVIWLCWKRNSGNNLSTMIILGLNAFHADSSAALVQDGKLIAAAEEERFRRIKHWAATVIQLLHQEPPP
jgi:hypothetical protein